MPGVAEKHGVGHFGPERQFGIFEDEVGNLSKASPHNGIVRVEPDVLDDFPYLLHVLPLCHKVAEFPIVHNLLSRPSI